MRFCSPGKGAGAPPIPADLKDDYLAAIEAAPEMFLASLKQKWDEEEIKTLLGGFAATKGYPKLGDVILRLDSSVVCLECEADLSSGYY